MVACVRECVWMCVYVRACVCVRACACVVKCSIGKIAIFNFKKWNFFIAASVLCIEDRKSIFLKQSLEIFTFLQMTEIFVFSAPIFDISSFSFQRHFIKNLTSKHFSVLRMATSYKAMLISFRPLFQREDFKWPSLHQAYVPSPKALLNICLTSIQTLKSSIHFIILHSKSTCGY